MITFGSLFAGIGGLDLGFERAGMECRWQVEIDDYCQKILSKHWPDVPKYQDVREVGKENLEPVDLICGGFPCQDISIAGKRRGITGERSRLWKEFARILGELRPRYAVIENVPNLINQGFDVVLIDLAKMGYDVEWGYLSASDFGAMHKRKRMFIIAHNESFRRNNDVHTSTLRHKTFNNRKAGGGKNEDCPIPRFITYDWLQRVQRFSEKQIQRKQGFSWCKDVRRVEELFGRPNIPEPLVCRYSDGFPNGVDRIKALGNAVVPQVAEFVGRCIVEFDSGG